MCAARAPPLLLRAARAPAPPSRAPPRPTRQVALRVYLGDTRGLPRPALYLPDAEDAPPLLADVNGDLRPDLVGQARNASVGGAEGDTVDGDAAPLVRTFWVNSLPAEPPACFNGERCGPRPARSLPQARRAPAPGAAHAERDGRRGARAGRDMDEQGRDCGGADCLPCACFAWPGAGMGAGVDSGCGFVLVEAPGMRGRPALSASRAGAFADVDGDCRADLLLPNAAGRPPSPPSLLLSIPVSLLYTHSFPP
jgi:hypothetical protein